MSTTEPATATGAGPGRTRGGRRRSRLAAEAGETFRSLRVRNYRLWFTGQFVSLVGYFAGMVAQALLVLDLTDDGSWLGLIIAVQFVPMLVVGPAAGVLSDRLDKRWLVFGTQATMMLCSLVLAALTLSGSVTLAWVFALTLASGLVWCIDQPARATIVVELVDDADCANAVSLNVAVGQIAKVVGPVVAGVVVPLFGVGWCFLLNGLSSLAVLAGLVLMRPSEIRSGPPVARSRGQIRAAVRYAARHPQLRLVFPMLLVVAVLSVQWPVLLPLLSTRDLGGDAGAYSMITASMSVGALAGTLWLARRRVMPVPTVVASCAALGLADLAVAASPVVPVACLAVAAMGVLMQTTISGIAVLIQLGTESAMRGRVMALFGMVAIGFNALGTPLVGTFAEALSARAALAVGGLAALATAAAARIVIARAAGGAHAVPDALAPVAVAAVD